MSRLPDLEAWVVFAKVVETGGFARAAEALSLSKGTVSKLVTRLETRLGTRLLHRTAHRLTLTDAGRQAAADAARLLETAEQAEAAALDQAAVPRGLVRLTAPVSFGVAHLAPLLPGLMKAFPEISLDIHLDDAVVDLLGGGFDLALRIGVLADSSLRARRLCAVRRPLVGAPAYLERFGAPARPADLAAHRVVGYANRPAAERMRFVNADGESESVALSGPLRTNNAEVALPALRDGLALSIAPEFMIWDDLQAGRLVEVMTGWQLPDAALWIVTPPGQRPARVGAVIDHLAARLSQAPWRGSA
ncbi:DNA-binding transcriptional LysR family regulator [Endobacter medicaginis]|uniref:DNA-binding transcriptional LysR family regulator n=2 Tax=Endobacter medicaginis TaxID=1181271 RepID=A0A839UZD1_9PROT|nr:LysR family transcriptional regulator [Endobacter medicaginis]MBB3172742.1 DNA-binding transcriptional LysR family regulator [Endobacter medicaginis]MCX5474349.1 LysR family transcriptional regulator [Endobacter medicaginis]